MNNQLDENYTNHNIFKKLNSYIKFYDSLSELIMPLGTIGVNAIVNIDTYVYSSISATLQSIRMLLADGKINDAFALLRKYYDATIINIYTNLLLIDNYSIENYKVEKIREWLEAKTKLPDYRLMVEYIRKSDRLKSITYLLRSDDRYKNIRELCNNHTHYNFFKYILLNDNQIYLKNRIQTLDNFLYSLHNIFTQHMAYTFYLNDHYMMSGDYIDHLECGEEPPADSQYWVATFIQNMFNAEIMPYRIDIYNEIKNATNMQMT